MACFALACSSSDEPDVAITDDQLEQLRLLEGLAEGIDVDGIELPPRPTVSIAPRDTRPLDDPPDATELDIGLDRSGRPYDVQQSWYDGSALVAEPLGTVHIADGDLRIMDGSILTVDPVDLLAGEYVAVGFDVERLDLTMLFAGYPPTDEQPVRRSVIGVRLDVPDAATVVEWQPYEFAYGTDGGVGGLTSGAIEAGAADQLPYSEGGDLFVDWDYELDYYLGEHAGAGGPDVFIYANGFGDGGFPMSRGLDAEDRLVSLVLPTLTYPWRLMIPDGEPPTDVTEREDQYVECLNGERAVTIDGTCLGDGEY